MNPIHVISQAKFFKGISPENQRALARICAAQEIRKGDNIFYEGKAGSAFYLLAQGQVQLHKTAPDGQEVVIKIIKAGEVFAEVVLFEKPNYPVTATALTSGLVLKILKRDLHQLLDDTAFRNDFISMLMNKQRYLADRVQQIVSASIEERFFNFLHDQYGDSKKFDVQITKKQIAAAIGTTPETLSRLIQRLQKEGAITWKGKTITLNAQR